ncbi:triose-phosphate isomerase [Candidatus Parcubacteria bacterium]|nr:triose-phosphate isomerase [Candidatus Parcubacteria bacterium]
MPKLIVANWKMNPATYAEAEELLASVLEGTRGARGVEVIICPPFVWLTDFSHKMKSISFGAQDVFWETQGAYTGEISPAMLVSSRVTHVIVGHSERRRHLGETDEMVNRKVRAALTAGLEVILCVGEHSRDEDDVVRVLDGQVSAALAGVPKQYLERLTVAYEPVWAIGTGTADTPNDALSAAISIRKTIRNLYDKKTASGVRVLYGGSVNTANAAPFLREEGIAGALVGGASLRAEEFIEIVRQAAAVG